MRTSCSSPHSHLHCWWTLPLCGNPHFTERISILKYIKMTSLLIHFPYTGFSILHLSPLHYIVDYHELCISSPLSPTLPEVHHLVATWSPSSLAIDFIEGIVEVFTIALGSHLDLIPFGNLPCAPHLQGQLPALHGVEDSFVTSLDAWCAPAELLGYQVGACTALGLVRAW